MVKKKVVRCRLAVLMAEQDPPLTQKRLAEETGLSPNTVNLLYQNKLKRIDIDTISKLCTYFECEIGDLFFTREIEDRD